MFKDDETAKAYRETRPEGEVVIDVFHWLPKLTLDIIGTSASSPPRDPVLSTLSAVRTES